MADLLPIDTTPDPSCVRCSRTLCETCRRERTRAANPGWEPFNVVGSALDRVLVRYPTLRAIYAVNHGRRKRGSGHGTPIVLVVDRDEVWVPTWVGAVSASVAGDPVYRVYLQRFASRLKGVLAAPASAELQADLVRVLDLVATGDPDESGIAERVAVDTLLRAALGEP